MAKKTRHEVAKEYDFIDHYKWQFLRRNPNYAKDCLAWSGGRRTRWQRSEVVVGYPYCGKLTDFQDYLKSRHVYKRVMSYYGDFNWEWQGLIDDRASLEALKAMGLHPVQYFNQGRWFPYFEKWQINLPLNPNMNYLPFFVRIAPKMVITEPAVKGVRNNVFENDYMLEKGTTSFIEVNWASPTKYLVHAFERMIRSKKEWLGRMRKLPEDLRTQFDKFDYYLQVWDLRHKSKMSLDEIADKLSEQDPRGKYDFDIKRALNAATKLVEGGYKHIG